MLSAAVAISVILSFLANELLGLLTGGMISGGYLALYMGEPFRILSTLLLSLLVFLLLKLFSRVMILYGRRRFMVAVVTSILLSFCYSRLFYLFSFINQDTRIIGFIIPGLIASDMDKQGILVTLIMVLLVAFIVWTAMHIGLLR